MARIRFLQTSDLHLRDDKPERLRALELVFAAAQTRNVDCLLIVGDLFDRTADAPGLRSFVRQLVEAVAPRPVVFLPGNHDHPCYGPDTDYGTNAVVLSATPWCRQTVCGVEVVGVPYQHGKTVAECLIGLGCDPRHTVLLAHGSLSGGAEWAFSGDGEDGAYMPIQLADLERRASYAALGHFHAGRSLVHRQGEKLLAYAGSPVTTSRRELGPRSALAVDFEPGVGVLSHELVPLATPFFQRVEVRCMPGAEDEAIAQLAREAASQRMPGARILARLSGISVLPEAELREAATRALAQAFALGPRTSASLESLAENPEASFALLELVTTSYATLAQVPVVGEFVDRLAACARAEGLDDALVLQAALRLGLDAFVESLS
jgi:hypothetical protein